MALSAKKLQEVMKEKRRRDKLPPRTGIVEPVPLTLKPRELRQVTERCSDVLLAIESTIVQSARELSMVDDLTVKNALTCLIRHTPSDVETVSSIVVRLEAVRESLKINEDDWSMSLRAICNSVILHSQRNAGSFSYLTQARDFVMKAQSARRRM